MRIIVDKQYNREFIFMFRLIILLACLSTSATIFASEFDFSTSSKSNRVAVLELYTSEGCSSCPPADEWLSNITDHGLNEDQVIPLAFHVDYWDYIGWKDPFASPDYTNRQSAHKLNNPKVPVYTPQFVLNGKVIRKRSSIKSGVKQVSGKTDAIIKLNASYLNDSKLHIKALSTNNPVDSELVVVLTENNLSNQIDAGENRGRYLEHSYVVRALMQPGSASQADEFERVLDIPASWKKQDLSLVAFLQQPDGNIVQATKLALQ